MVPKKRNTIHEVADAAKVSRQTVSRVLNNRPDVAPETRVRVQEVIDRLGYQPSEIARSLSQKRSYSFGVVTAGLKFRGPSKALNGITEKAEELGYSLLLKELLSFESKNVDQLLQWLLARQMDGIIWAVPEVGENRKWLKSQLSKLSVPIIFLTMSAQENVSIVSVDNYYGARLATEHLLEIGRRNIAHVSGPLSWWEARERKRAWEDVLNETGLSVEAHHWYEGTWSPASGDRAIRELLKNYPEMDAVFVGNDQMALSVMQVAAREGYKIPEDIAVVGFDGIRESEYFWPPLTTVFQDMYELGSKAVQELVKLVDQNQASTEKTLSSSEQILIKPELVIRESTNISQ